MTTKRIMIDCETMSLADNASIVQLAAVEFGHHSNQFNFYIDPTSAELHGAVDRETMEWWNAPERAEIRKIVFSGTALTPLVMEAFIAWCYKVCEGDWENLKVYSLGGQDYNWVKNCTEYCALPWPFHYRASQNMRSLQDAAEYCNLILPEVPTKGKHDALNDCLWQVEMCENILVGLSFGRIYAS